MNFPTDHIVLAVAPFSHVMGFTIVLPASPAAGTTLSRFAAADSAP